MKKITKAEVSQISRISKDIYRIKLICPDVLEGAKAGRFVNVYPKAKDTILARPLGISETDETGITLVFEKRGKGTREFSEYKEGEEVTLSTPLGNGFDLSRMGFKGEERSSKSIALISGGVGAAPMVKLAGELREEGYLNVHCFMGFKSEAYLTEEMEQRCASVRTALETDDKNVLDIYREAQVLHEEEQSGGFKADYAFACGPRPMLKALAQYFMEKKIPLQVSMEERMGCGYGACVGCVCATLDGLKKVCTDGPVFMAEEVEWDE